MTGNYNPKIFQMGEMQCNRGALGKNKQMRKMLEEGELPMHRYHHHESSKGYRHSPDREQERAERLCQGQNMEGDMTTFRNLLNSENNEKPTKICYAQTL